MRTHWLRISRELSSLVVLLLLAACGGGGGEEGDGGAARGADPADPRPEGAVLNRTPLLLLAPALVAASAWFAHQTRSR